MKKIINFLLVFMTLLSFAQAADLYQTYQPSFTSNTPQSIYVAGAECGDNSCTTITTNQIELYNGDEFNSCWNNYGQDGNSNNFVSCVANAKINGNIVNLSQMSKIVIKENTNSSFGYIKQFFTSNDSYLPLYSRSSNYQCNYDICVDTQLKHLNFEKKANAIAEVGQVNIKNIDNKLLPVQITVPVSIDETVCSAFRFTDSNMYKFHAPTGYSDYSANTLVNLVLTNANTGVKYLNQSITIPIEADQCAGLAAFSWTPDSSLENVPVNFNISTDVIDNQVSSSIKDYASVQETIYPKNLSNSAWARAYDFTLSNVNSFNLNTSVAQISEGETLNALFRAGAYTGNNKTPIDFEAIVLFNNTVVYQTLEHSTTSLTNFSFDLSNSIKNLAAGSYEVKLITKPISNVANKHNVEQIQHLQLLVPNYSHLNFFVRDTNDNKLANANINLKLLSADDYYQIAPTFNSNIQTNLNGFGVFNNLVSGNYQYTISKNNYTTVTNQIHVASNMDAYIRLPGGNTAPIVNLPASITENYKNEIKIDLTNYISDFNDAFSDLTITTKLLSGNIAVNKQGNYLILSTNQPNVGNLQVFAQDPSGEVSSGIVKIVFTDNSAPVINQFYAEPTNGEEPFNTTFHLNVTDSDNDSLTCTVDFGDNNIQNINCGQTEIDHTYINVGSYKAIVTVNDGTNKDVKANEWVYVFNRTVDAPLINSFKITTTNGYIIPTDITLNWLVTHPGNKSMTCSLRINGVSQNVNCAGSYSINHFNITGSSRFTIIALDSDGNQVLRSLDRTFYNNSVSLNNLKTKLIVNSKIIPGEFAFAINTTDEILAKRDISIKPIIECLGVENTLDNTNKLLSTKAVSLINSSVRTFNFKTNTNNYALDVPIDTNCKFKVDLTDEYGTNLILSKDVVFSYPVAERKIQSIRGKTTDIVNYMSSSLSNEMKTGYNSIEFNIKNNNFKEKDLVITVTSNDLDISQTQDIPLAPGQERTIQVPLLIKKSTKSGMYPLRFSVYDGSDKQVRYSYVRVN